MARNAFAGFFQWEKGQLEQMEREHPAHFLSHGFMWAAQIPLLYVYEKPICSLALSAVTTASMAYHASLGTEDTKMTNTLMYLDYLAVLAGSLTAVFLPLGALPSPEDWLETGSGQATIVLTVIMGLMALYNMINKTNSTYRKYFHSFWHFFVVLPIILYASIKKDVRDVWKDSTVDQLQITVILVFVCQVLPRGVHHCHDLYETPPAYSARRVGARVTLANTERNGLMF
tara:strand:- start:625 stop:1314 length:690 start_codon:yes stop_codon:yes gene_type:complete